MLSAHLLFILITVAGGVSLAHGALCTGDNATTYLRSEGTRLMEFATHTIKDVTLNTCADACTMESNGHVCSSFEYDAKSQECSIHAEDGQPFGPSVLAKSDAPVAFFQHICVNSQSLCPAPFAFERYPQSLLIGHAMKVLAVSGLSECLSRCLTAATTLNTQCRSLMYFYESGECIINRERRTDKPDLFLEGVQDQLVDYFENNCLDVQCFSGQLHWIRTEEYSISHEKDVIIESMSMDECRTVCQVNLIGTERFPCRAFVYNSGKNECHLSAESGYTGHRGNSFNLNPISSGEYFEKYCLQVPIACKDASFEQVPDRKMTSLPYKEFGSTSIHKCLATCLEDGAQCATAVYNYDIDLCSLSETSQFSNPELFVTAENTDYFDKVCDPAPAAKRSAVEGVTNIPQSNAIDTNEDDRVTSLVRADEEEISKAMDYIKTSTPPDYHEFTTTSNIVGQKEAEAEGTVIDDMAEFENVQRTPNTVKARLSSVCHMSGINVNVEFASPTSGSIYIKDHFATCRMEFSNATTSFLNIPFPTNDDPDPKCPGTEIDFYKMLRKFRKMPAIPQYFDLPVLPQDFEYDDSYDVASPTTRVIVEHVILQRIAPSMWSFSVIVQKNDMGSPSLVTSTDRMFNVSCDYNEIEKEKGSTTITSEGGNEVTSSRIEMQILRNGHAVTTVPLGDEVELRWTITDTSDGLGYFVDECKAERVGGSPPEPEPLKLIEHGCPVEKVKNRLINSLIIREVDGFSTKLKVFRFDGSRRVRIRCTIDVCVDHCPTITCEGLEDGTDESLRRWRRESAKDLNMLMKKAKPAFSMDGEKPSTPLTKRIVTGTITITDYEKKQKRPRPEFASMPEDQYCLLRSHLVIALVVFCILSIIQLFVLLNCLHSRCTSLPDNASYSTATSSTSRSYISSCHYRSASLEMSKPLPPTPSELALSQPYQVSATSR